MKKVLCVFLMSMALSVQAQTGCSADEWIKDFVLEAETVSPETDFLNELDFAPLWLDSQTCYLGYIGDDYQRLHIYFTEIERTSANTYKVKGSSKVKTNTCNFEGSIKITGIREYSNIDTATGEELETEPTRQGFVMADFSFGENKEQKFSGMFSGKATLNNTADKAYVFIFGLPYLTNRISINSEHDIINVRLLSICPPTTLRPYFQEGYLVGTDGISDDYETKGELDFNNRLVAKFEIPNNESFWGKDFNGIPEALLYPEADPVLDLCREVKILLDGY